MNTYLKFFIVFLVLIVIVIGFLIYYQYINEKSIHQIIYPKYYKNKFAEKEFPPVENEREYFSKVKSGYKSMKKESIAVIGLVYNLGEDKIHKLMKRLSFLTKKWKDYRIILYGADSTDYSFDILKSYAELNSKIILPEDYVNKKGLNRIQKMSRLRNILIKSLLKSNFNPDYVLLQDCDLASALSLDGLAHSVSYMSKDKKYDAIFANGVSNEFIFDYHLPYIGYFCYDNFAYLEDPKNNNRPNLDKMAFRRGEPLCSVISAFNGAGLYKYSVFKQFKYDEKELDECEHVTFNRKIYKKGYKLAINPSLLLISGRQGETTHKTSSKQHLGKDGYYVSSIIEDSYHIF